MLENSSSPPLFLVREGYMIQFLPKTLQRISEINTVNHFDQSSKWGKRGGAIYVQSNPVQGSWSWEHKSDWWRGTSYGRSKFCGRQNRLRNSGHAQVFGYLLLVATSKPQSCENWSITNDKIFCCLNIYVFRFSSKIRSFQFLNTKYATDSLNLVSNCYCLQMYIISLSGRYATYRTLYHSKSVFISKLCGKR